MKSISRKLFLVLCLALSGGNLQAQPRKTDLEISKIKGWVESRIVMTYSTTTGSDGELILERLLHTVDSRFTVKGMKESVCVFSEGKMVSSTKYTYDKSGLLLQQASSIMFSGPEATPKATKQYYIYNSDSLITQVLHEGVGRMIPTIEDGGRNRKESQDVVEYRFYDQQERLVRIESYQNGHLYSSYAVDYDDDGYASTQILQNRVGNGVITTHLHNEFDGKGRLTRVISQQGESTYHESTYQYDDNDQVVFQSIRGGKSGEAHSYYENHYSYKYDHNGNVVEKIITDKDGRSTVEKIMIEYYIVARSDLTIVRGSLMFDDSVEFLSEEGE